MALPSEGFCVELKKRLDQWLDFRQSSFSLVELFDQQVLSVARTARPNTPLTQIRRSNPEIGDDAARRAVEATFSNGSGGRSLELRRNG